MKSTNKTKYAILGALNMKPASGYDIKKFFDMSVSNFWSENYAHIYPVLKEMEDEALVKSIQEKNGGRPEKSIYSITEEGRQGLHEWLEKPVEYGPTRNELLLKLFFAGELPIQKVIELLEAQNKDFKKELERYFSIEDSLKSLESAKANKDFPFWYATVRYGIISLTSIIEWCEDTIKTFQEIENKN